MVQFKSLCIALVCVAKTSALCPFGFGNSDAVKYSTGHHATVQAGLKLGRKGIGIDNLPSQYEKFVAGLPSAPIIPPTQPSAEYKAAMKKLDIAAVQEDIKNMLTDSQDWWQADFGNYGPLFIRLAWHCSGSFRETDGRGGCSGGRQRFEPERSWEDNANLDKARRLLWPVKEKYGLGLSWGDLFTMAGTTAIQSMGGPTLGVCVGRVDDVNGARSNDLGPTPIQEAFAPCTQAGNCTAPLGTTTLGLIYVNPEGPMGEPKPEESALEVRDTFARMGMDDRETVALIGGGHSFGKAHGSCEAGPGLAPLQTEALGLNADTEAWQGGCGTGADRGVGANTVTSGIEGPWTRNPTSWDNGYFKNLVNYDWEAHKGPGGKWQWRVASAKAQDRTAFLAPNGSGGVQEIMMLTSDIALKRDPIYLPIVEEFAKDQSKLDETFAAAWHKLTTRAFGAQRGPRCLSPAAASSSVMALRGGHKQKLSPKETQCAEAADDNDAGKDSF